MKGQRLGNYQLLECLGCGGHACSYLARHIYLDSQSRYVVKVLNLNQAEDTESERFLREAMLASRIRHPNVIQVFDLQEERGVRYIVMEYAHGTPLEKLIRRSVQLSLEQICHIGVQIADGMSAVHREGIVHRDLKPDNILVTRHHEHWRAMLIDFGLSYHAGYRRLTPKTNVCGTPVYVAPELCRGLTPTPRSDIYSFGIVLYEMISGRVPFDGNHVGNILLQHIHEPPPPLPRRFPGALQDSMARLINSMLAKDEKHRPQSMSEVAKILQTMKINSITSSSRLRTTPAVRAEAPSSSATSMDLWELQQSNFRLNRELQQLRKLLKEQTS